LGIGFGCGAAVVNEDEGKSTMGLFQTMGDMHVAAVEHSKGQMSPTMLAAVDDLTKAAQLVENAAMSLAGDVEGGRVTHLLLLSQQLERISSTLSETAEPT
jgi:hypothetical protein